MRDSVARRLVFSGWIQLFYLGAGYIRRLRCRSNFRLFLAEINEKDFFLLWRKFPDRFYTDRFPENAAVKNDLAERRTNLVRCGLEADVPRRLQAKRPTVQGDMVFAPDCTLNNKVGFIKDAISSDT